MIQFIPAIQSLKQPDMDTIVVLITHSIEIEGIRA